MEPLLRGGVPRTVNNEEYQVVGIPTDATPFDFDNNPNTPATNVNPYPFTENALREEMGVPLRDRYDVDEAPRI
ncbi:M91 family zinc metallopeptidase [Pseudomonas sp. MF7448]|uniref:M91 family zinc metallopeptidase n=1 Tax=Pseudomonas sp. MF7448 TaxID=2797537 RepID=UPI002277EA7B|nr:M91 family zinc metallopeptidase [Pseudomonas sp. MF7448]